jgi:outer membrane protein TolC
MQRRPVPHGGALPGTVRRPTLAARLLLVACLLLVLPAYAEDSVDITPAPAPTDPPVVVLEIQPETMPSAVQPAVAPPPVPIEPLGLDSFLAPSDPGQLLAYLAQDYVPPEPTLSLEDAIRLALANNHGVNQQRLTAAAAVQDVRVNWAALKPQLSARGNIGWSYTNSHPQPTVINIPGQAPITFGGGGGGASGPTETVALNLTQRIYDFGLTADMIDLAEARHAIEHYAVTVAEQRLVDDVAFAYLNYSLALGFARIRVDEVRLAEEILRQARIQFDVGTVPRLDVIRAEARLETAHGNLIQARADIGNAAALFYSLLGLEDQRYLPALITEHYVQLGLEPPPVNDAIAAGLQYRPEIMVQSSTLLAGQETRKLAKNRPIIEADGNWAYTNPKPGGQGTYNLGLNVSINWPLYTGGKDKIERQRADLEIASIAEGIHQLEADIELDVTTAWNNAVAARQQADVARKNLELSGETLRAAYIGYQAGVTTYLDFTDALDRNVAAALGYLFALVEVRLANIDLQRAQGYPQGYPADSRPEFDPSVGIESVLGISATDATASVATPQNP